MISYLYLIPAPTPEPAPVVGSSGAQDSEGRFKKVCEITHAMMDRRLTRTKGTKGSYPYVNIQIAVAFLQQRKGTEGSYPYVNIRIAAAFLQQRNVHSSGYFSCR